MVSFVLSVCKLHIYIYMYVCEFARVCVCDIFNYCAFHSIASA